MGTRLNPLAETALSCTISSKNIKGDILFSNGISFVFIVEKYSLRASFLNDKQISYS